MILLLLDIKQVHWFGYRNNTNNVTTPILLTIHTSGEAGGGLRNRVAARLREFEFQLVIGDRVDNNAVSFFGMQSHTLSLCLLLVTCCCGILSDRCPAENTTLRAPNNDKSLDFNITWPVTLLGATAVQECPCGFNLSSTALIASRTCGGDFDTGAQWMEPNDDPCDFSITARRLCRLAMVNCLSSSTPSMHASDLLIFDLLFW